mgnify:CR=1 FL=1
MKVSMPDWAGLILVVLVIMVVYGWHQQNDPRPRRAAATSSAPRTSVPSTPNPNGRDIGNDRELIRAVSETYDVPAGLLYGIWRKESAGLRSGFGTGAGWYLTTDLVARGGRCLREYNAARCARWRESLRAICNQRRGGVPICTPDEVRTSYAFAMGPMQVLPTNVVTVREDGTTAWTAHAVDFDRDGIVDPHSLPDAMAITARFVRRSFEERRTANPGASETDSWIWAANSYYGSQSLGYYEGTTAGRRGIQDYWREWCDTTGLCRSGEVFAAR